VRRPWRRTGSKLLCAVSLNSLRSGAGVSHDAIDGRIGQASVAPAQPAQHPRTKGTWDGHVHGELRSTWRPACWAPTPQTARSNSNGVAANAISPAIAAGDRHWLLGGDADGGFVKVVLLLRLSMQLQVDQAGLRPGSRGQERGEPGPDKGERREGRGAASQAAAWPRTTKLPGSVPGKWHPGPPSPRRHWMLPGVCPSPWNSHPSNTR